MLLYNLLNMIAIVLLVGGFAGLIFGCMTRNWLSIAGAIVSISCSMVIVSTTIGMYNDLKLQECRDRGGHHLVEVGRGLACVTEDGRLK